jgi:hypothetical protein
MMNSWLRVVALTVIVLISQPSIAGEAVPINATFGIAWTPVDWSDPTDRITESLGAAQLPGGRTVGIATRDHLNTVTGRISSDYVILAFSDTDWVYAQYTEIRAGYDPATNTAGFGGPLEVVGGEGRFVGASGTLTIKSKILFSLPVGTFAVKGVIRTVD